MRAHLTLFDGMRPVGESRPVEVAMSADGPESVTWRFSPRGQVLAVPRGERADGWGFIDEDGRPLHVGRLSHAARYGDTVQIAGRGRHL